MSFRTLLRLSIAAAVLVSAFSLAEGAPSSCNWFYVFVSPGGALGAGEETENFLYMGPGFDRQVSGKFCLGGSVGYLAHMKELDETSNQAFSLSGFGENWFWVSSVNATYYLFGCGGPAKQAYFATLGYSLFVRDGHRNLLNIGLGKHHTFSSHYGLRLEFRDSIMRTDSSYRHFLELRIGLAFH